jgi:tetratricopeptide (TPR) repeat protein
VCKVQWATRNIGAGAARQAHFRKSLPNTRSVFLGVGLCLSACGSLGVALAYTPQINEASAEWESKRGSSEQLVEAGILLARQGKFDEAFANFSEAIRSNPKFALAYLNRGIAFANRGDLERALADFEATIELVPGDLRARLHVGAIHWRERKYQLAIADFNRIIEMDPQFADAYAGRSLVWAALGQHRFAIADCDHAVALGLKTANVYATRGYALLALGQNDKAAKDFVAAAHADPVHAKTLSDLITMLQQ